MRSLARQLALWTAALSPLAATAHCAAQGGSSQSASPQSTRPNLLFLFADDQRPDSIAAFGNPHIDTPTLDTLAGSGFRFAQNYCMGSIHGAVCQPSRAMLMSGRTLWRVPMDLSGVRTMPESFAKTGYSTFVTGKWHNGSKSVTRAFQHGKAVMIGGMSDHTQVPLRDFDGEGGLTKVRRGEGFSSEIFADAAVEFLSQHDATAGPFFCYVSFTAPHDPRQPPMAYRKKYSDAPPPLPPNFKPQHPFHNGWMTGRDETLAAWPRDPAVIRQQLGEYYGMISHLDAQIARVLATLEARGMRDNTIVVYTADHGLALGSHGLLGKQSLYEHSMGCPLIIAGPGIPMGETRALSYLYDLYPTLCDLCDVPMPQGLEGHSLRPILHGEKKGVRDSLFTTYEDSMRAVRDPRYKLIRYPRIDHVQLFDLQDDPHELTNLATSKAHSTHRTRLEQEMLRWRERVGDRASLAWDPPRPMDIDLSGRARKPDRWQPDWIVEKYFER